MIKVYNPRACLHIKISMENLLKMKKKSTRKPLMYKWTVCLEVSTKILVRPFHVESYDRTYPRYVVNFSESPYHNKPEIFWTASSNYCIMFIQL